jgi:RHS repeat-associated protein
MQQTVNGEAASYTLDLNSSLTQVLADSTHSYLYGVGRIAQSSIENPQSEIGYFLGDALGSVRQLTDEGGTVTLTQSYSPYGDVLSSMGDSSSVYGYTGEWTDVTGLVYLRARYYDPLQGRFMTRDVWGGDGNNPISYNAWLYVYANLVNLTDPSGQMPLADFENYDDSDSARIEKDIISRALNWIARRYSGAFNRRAQEMNAAAQCLPPEIRSIRIPWPIHLIDPFIAFMGIHGGKIRFTRYPLSLNEETGIPSFNYPGDTQSKNHIRIFWPRLGQWNTGPDRIFYWRDDGEYERFIVHEVGHAFDNALNFAPRKTIAGYSYLLTPDVTSPNGFFGTQGQGWQRRANNLSGYNLTYEIFADQFIGWVYRKWQEEEPGILTPLGQKRSDFMNLYMPPWIMMKLLNQ